MHQLVDTFVDRESRAEQEDDDRHDEGPKVGLLAVAEGMRLGRRTRRALQAEEEQHLIAAVGGRVKRFGQHGRRASSEEADELGDGDAEIRKDPGEERLDDSVLLIVICSHLDLSGFNRSRCRRAEDLLPAPSGSGRTSASFSCCNPGARASVGCRALHPDRGRDGQGRRPWFSACGRAPCSGSR